MQRSPLRPFELLVLLAALVAGRAWAMRAAPASDETSITWRYAENLAHGQGLVFNPGAAWEPVLGTSSPGYAVLLAPAVLVWGDAGRAAPRLNIALDVLTALLLASALRARPRLALLALAVFAAHPGLALASAGGTESAALVAVGVATAWALERRAFVAAGILAGLAVVVRIEAAMLLPVALGLAASAPRRQLLGILLPAVLVVVAFGAWLESTYGASGASLPLAHTARLVAARELSFGACVGGALRGAFAPAAWAIPFSVLGLARLGWRSRPLGAPAVALFGLLTIPIAVILRVQPTDPLFALAWFALALLAADALDIAVPERVGARTRAAAPGLALLALAVAPFVHGDPGGRAVRAELRAWAQETGFAKSELVLFARDGAGVAAHACGGIVLDARGRTWPAGLAGDEAQLIAAALPDYLLLETSRPALEALRADDELARGYYPVRRFSAAGATELDPATDDLPAVASADWLLFRRGL